MAGASPVTITARTPRPFSLKIREMESVRWWIAEGNQSDDLVRCLRSRSNRQNSKTLLLEFVGERAAAGEGAVRAISSRSKVSHGASGGNSRIATMMRELNTARLRVPRTARSNRENSQRKVRWQ